jgi:competence ComEA-like helix-hairpin-helix protein
MNNSWFESTIRSWTPDDVWGDNDLTIASTLLSKISSYNGGETINDSQISQSIKSAYAINRAEDAIQRYINSFCYSANIHKPNRYYKTTIESEHIKLLPFLSLKKLARRIDINLATSNELESLPGIGKITASRIIDYREKDGPIKDLKELLNLKGISKNEIEKFQGMVYISSPLEEQFLCNQLLNNFYSDPSIYNYFKLKADRNSAIHKIVISELENVLSNLAIKKYAPLKTLPIARASTANEEITLDKQVDEQYLNAPKVEAYGRLIFDSQYGPFIENLLNECKASIRMIMFFFRFEDEKNYPTDPLIKKIIQAKSGGADVKIILNIDDDSGPYDSEKINGNAFKYLSDHGINVNFDDPEKVTHSKIIIMDSRHVIVGSHNWTAGSFYQYDDTSVYIDSEEIAKNYELDFENRWQKLQT